MAITQGEAVYQAVNEVIGDRLKAHQEEGMAVQLSDAQLDQVHSKVLLSFQTGQTVHSKNPTEAQLRKYIPGLVNNWLRKDSRLNGNTKYTTKKPGSRSGSGDESVKAMRTLLSVTTDPAAKAQIQAAIDERIAALKPTPEINAALLPESLRHLVG